MASVSSPRSHCCKLLGRAPERHHLRGRRQSRDVCFRRRQRATYVVFADDVVAVENGPRPVPADLHGDGHVDPRPYHVPHRRSTEVVEEFFGETCLPTRALPGLPEIAHLPAGTVEDVCAGELPSSNPPLNDCPKRSP